MRLPFAKEFGCVCFQRMAKRGNVLGIFVLEFGHPVLILGALETLLGTLDKLFGRRLQRRFFGSHFLCHGVAAQRCRQWPTVRPKWCVKSEAIRYERRHLSIATAPVASNISLVTSACPGHPVRTPE
jgi:hypothetical protein